MERIVYFFYLLRRLYSIFTFLTIGGKRKYYYVTLFEGDHSVSICEGTRYYFRLVIFFKPDKYHIRSVGTINHSLLRKNIPLTKS